MKMNTTYAAIALSLGIVAASNAAIVTYSSQIFSNATDVSTNGTLIRAVNLGSSDGFQGAATADVTINGVTFTASTAGANNGLFADAGNIYFDAASFSGAITGVSTTDANALLDSIEFGPGTGNSLATLTGLIIGQVYEIQMFNARNDGVTVDYGYAATVGGAEVYSLTGVTRAPTAPSLVTGTFTATATSQEIHVAIAGSTNLEVSAYQLRTIPEPSSAALLGLGGLALILRRRK